MVREEGGWWGRREGGEGGGKKWKSLLWELTNFEINCLFIPIPDAYFLNFLLMNVCDIIKPCKNSSSEL